MERPFNPKQQKLKYKCKRIRAHLRNLRRQERFWLRHMKRLRTFHKQKEKRELKDLRQRENHKKNVDGKVIQSGLRKGAAKQNQMTKEMLKLERKRRNWNRRETAKLNRTLKRRRRR